MMNKFGIAAAPITPQMFGSAGKEHMEKYGKNLLGGVWIDFNVRFII